MKAARFAVALAAVLAASGSLIPAQAANGEDPVRRRAEELAEAANRRFNEVLSGERIAQAQQTAPAAKPAPSKQGGGSDDPYTLLLQWLDHSNHEYQSLMRRLSAGSQRCV